MKDWALTGYLGSYKSGRKQKNSLKNRVYLITKIKDFNTKKKFKIHMKNTLMKRSKKKKRVLRFQESPQRLKFLRTSNLIY